jgi:hypothetical protein
MKFGISLWIPETPWKLSREPQWNFRIRVPFSPEIPASGIGDTGFYRACWYRREFETPNLDEGERLLRSIIRQQSGSTDMQWPGTRGGYTPFSSDITDYLVQDPQSVVVWAEDDPSNLSKPRGVAVQGSSQTFL